MTDAEFMANISNVSTDELFDKLEYFGCDSYYLDLWQCVLGELKRRMEADNAPTVEEKENFLVIECRKASIAKGLPLFFIYYGEAGFFEAYITETNELFEKRRCSKYLSKYEFEKLARQYLDNYSDWKGGRE